MSTERPGPVSHAAVRWTVPGTCVVVAIAYLAIGIAHDNVLWGALCAAVMFTLAVALVLGQRRESDTAALMSAASFDERHQYLETRSIALTGRVLIVSVTAGLFWSLAAGNQYRPVFTTLAAIGGFTLIGAQVWNARRG